MNSILNGKPGRRAAMALGAAVMTATLAWSVSPRAATRNNSDATKPNPPSAPATAKSSAPESSDTARRSYAGVVKQVTPSVVKVNVSTKMKTMSQSGGMGLPPGLPPQLRRFFGEGDMQGMRPNLRVPPQHGLGSGVLVTEDGYILTNNHVVDQADEVTVTLQDGRDYSAKVVGKDPKTDVAVLKIDAKDLPHLAMADSDRIEVGDVVLAVGNPFGIGQTVTMGIVSATGRATLGLDYEDFIQTDAPINPGNSGGALVDADGRLIGINTAILSQSGGNHGIGFAIPTNLARDVMDSLVKDGKVTRGYLGIMIQDLTPALAKEFKMEDRQGALVGDVVPKGPADKGGIESGDVIVEYNGKAVKDSRHLKLAVASTAPGKTVSMKVMRDGSAKTLDVTVKELPGSDEVAKNGRPAGDEEGTLDGVGVSDLDREGRQQFDIPDGVKGALVTDVAEGSAAAEAGLKPGDVIQEINRKPVKDAEAAVQMTAKAKDQTTLVKVWSNGGTRYVVVDESKRG